MFKKMKNFIIQILTGIDNTTFDIVRVLGFVAGVVMIGIAIYLTIVTGAFDFIAFGGAFTGLLVSIGGGVALKQNAEPKPIEEAEKEL